MDSVIVKKSLVVAAIACALCNSGCASTITRWMVELRTSQGDAALAKPSLAEAQKEYTLALELDPKNAHARAGLAQALYQIARNDFVNSKLDEAATEIQQALKYAPSDAAALALANEIQQAKIRREIVIANYPLYGSINAALQPAFKQISASKNEIATQVKAFSSDFDTSHLSKAITESYDLEDEVHRTALRLINYRGLVQTGTSKAAQPAAGEAPSLLPIP